MVFSIHHIYGRFSKKSHIDQGYEIVKIKNYLKLFYVTSPFYRYVVYIYG